MDKRQVKTFMTWLKYLVWYGIAALLNEGAATVLHAGLPLWAVPILASVMKAAATWVASKQGTSY